jgi:DMSO/TMAO reductase YedYZ molybdopterin-dependent catalytic subunit
MMGASLAFAAHRAPETAMNAEPSISLTIAGEVTGSRRFTAADLAALPGQIPDVSTRLPGRVGRGIELRALLAAAGVGPRATHVTVSADGGSFHASVPLEAVAEAIIIYGLDDGPLPRSEGGPLRFFIPDVARWAGAGVDHCANVKRIETITLTAGPGADTRPSTRPIRGPA